MSLRMALLGLLASRGPSSGYALTRDFAGSLSHVWAARHSQVYPELARMFEAGLIGVEDTGPRGRKRYYVTGSGREELRCWLTGVEPSRTVRSEVALRAFLLPTLGPEVAAGLARAEERFHRERAEEIGRLRDLASAGGGSGFGAYAAELGVRLSAATAEWARWAAEQLEADARAEAAAATTPAEDEPDHASDGHAARTPPDRTSPARTAPDSTAGDSAASCADPNPRAPQAPSAPADRAPNDAAPPARTRAPGAPPPPA
ncbi:putative transcriptional regulator [Actinacidiphila reveromycinica]|uniref:Putative transcriptional regulator n=1 Tax=Actinacidiphila reveromycinica TaxID=659352 RepID=A0A7U3UWY1_9ACTN|nr:PadR family transcriptional regulator [Streptomyces sp. SN-593]BBB00298.1 putative transcriptional regulator [Streptomyces sp. SN-593]